MWKLPFPWIWRTTATRKHTEASAGPYSAVHLGFLTATTKSRIDSHGPIPGIWVGEQTHRRIAKEREKNQSTKKIYTQIGTESGKAEEAKWCWLTRRNVEKRKEKSKRRKGWNRHETHTTGCCNGGQTRKIGCGRWTLEKRMGMERDWNQKNNGRFLLTETGDGGLDDDCNGTWQRWRRPKGDAVTNDVWLRINLRLRRLLLKINFMICNCKFEIYIYIL